jgi:hypothetical protein
LFGRLQSEPIRAPDDCKTVALAGLFVRALPAGSSTVGLGRGFETNALIQALGGSGTMTYQTDPGGRRTLDATQTEADVVELARALRGNVPSYLKPTLITASPGSSYASKGTTRRCHPVIPPVGCLSLADHHYRLLGSPRGPMAKENGWFGALLSRNNHPCRDEMRARQGTRAFAGSWWRAG